MNRRIRRQGVLEEVADGSADRFSQFSGAPWGMRPAPGDALPAPRDGGSPILRRRHHPEVPHRKMNLPSRRARPELPRAGRTRLTRGGKPAPIAEAALRPGPLVAPAPPPPGREDRSFRQTSDRPCSVGQADAAETGALPAGAAPQRVRRRSKVAANLSR